MFWILQGPEQKSVPNKHTGGKIFNKLINIQTLLNRPGFFKKNNKHTGLGAQINVQVGRPRICGSVHRKKLEALDLKTNLAIYVCYLLDFLMDSS